MITTEFVPGAPCWLDLGSPDVPAAVAFYRAVLGWDFEPMPGEESEGGGESGGGGSGGSGADEGSAGGFGLLRSDGDLVGAIGPLTEEGARSAWMIYYRTDDAQATTRAVEEAGGTVRVPPTEGGGWATAAQYSDPQGGQFAVWQPGRAPGLEAVDRPGSLMWTELYTTDGAAARSFYRSVFGWRYDDMELPGEGGTYGMITPADQPTERMQGGLMQLPAEMLALTGGRPYWHPVFNVTDCDTAVATVAANGGTVQMGPADTPDVGRLAVCVDPWGADFVVLTPVNPPTPAGS
ncbi:VOC family protein [Kitasatospora cinereorecta]|uniref:VOC family protein n=1 Tax=Kitasatospora cinereorecta TaxID=285560 RepID=A0ABW0VGH4_9ACTN